MKYMIPLLIVIITGNFFCRKNPTCKTVTITQSGTLCSNWGVKIGANTYPSGNIPDNFKEEGKIACVEYELYEDKRLCVCCGGTWANIKSIK